MAKRGTQRRNEDRRASLNRGGKRGGSRRRGGGNRHQKPVGAIIAAAALLLVVAGAVVAAVDRGARTGGSRAADATANAVPDTERSRVPAIQGKTLEGKRISLAGFKGKPVVLNVWASWCEVCDAEADDFGEFMKGHPEVQFLGLDVEDSKSGAFEFMNRHGWTQPSIVDSDRRLEAKFGLIGQPHTVLIDEEGRIAAVHQGGATLDQFEGLLDALKA